MNTNGNTPISWKAVATVLAGALYALVLWIAGSTLAEVKAMRKDMAAVQRKNDVQDQRLETLEAWTFRRMQNQGSSAGGSN